MAANPDPTTTPMLVEVRPALLERIRAEATRHDLSVGDYVVKVLERATLDEQSDWYRLSAPSLARDWSSDEDAVYDDLR